MAFPAVEVAGAVVFVVLAGLLFVSFRRAGKRMEAHIDARAEQKLQQYLEGAKSSATNTNVIQIGQGNVAHEQTEAVRAVAADRHPAGAALPGGVRGRLEPGGTSGVHDDDDDGADDDDDYRAGYLCPDDESVFRILRADRDDSDGYGTVSGAIGMAGRVRGVGGTDRGADGAGPGGVDGRSPVHVLEGDPSDLSRRPELVADMLRRPWAYDEADERFEG